MPDISKADLESVKQALTRIPILENALHQCRHALCDVLPILEQRRFVPIGGVTACTVGPEVQRAIELAEAVLTGVELHSTEMAGV